MISLYTWFTPNGRKISIMLEELGLPYQIVAVNLGQGQQRQPAFLAISPNSKIPAIVDQTAAGDISVFESGAILTYLAEKHGRFLDASGPGRYKALEWLHWHMGGLGPVMAQLFFFEKMSQEKSPVATQRFAGETRRLLDVMQNRLSESPYLAGDEYSIADIANYSWVMTAAAHFDDVLGGCFSGRPALQRWADAIGARPAVQRGMAVPAQ